MTTENEHVFRALEFPVLKDEDNYPTQAYYDQLEERGGTVGEVIDQRVSVYGNPLDGFVRIAQTWSGILGVEVQPAQVPLCLIGMKAVRASVTPEYADNSDDIEGYLDIFRQLVGEDMIHARSVAEFVELRASRGQA